MIDLIISDECPHCEEQLDVMQKSFFVDEYRIIKAGTKEFEEYEDKGTVDAVPFVFIRDEDGAIKYAGKGIHDGTRLRKIERGNSSVAFNLRRQRQSLVG